MSDKNKYNTRDGIASDHCNPLNDVYSQNLFSYSSSSSMERCSISGINHAKTLRWCHIKSTVVVRQTDEVHIQQHLEDNDTRRARYTLIDDNI